MAKIVSSTDSDDPDYVEEQSSEDGSDVERERLHKRLWHHFKLGHSREGTLIELCRELHEKEIDSDKASKWFQYVDGDASGGIEETGGDYCVLTESVVDYFQRFKTEISQWSNHFIDAFTFLDSRYAVYLRYKTSKRQMFVLDNFYGQKMKLQINGDLPENVFSSDIKLYTLDLNHLILLECDNCSEYFDIYLLQLDFANQACKVLSNERMYGISPELIFDCTNRYRFLLRFNDSHEELHWMMRVEECKPQLEKIDPDLVVLLRHYYKKGLNAQHAYEEIVFAEGNLVQMNTVTRYFKSFQHEFSADNNLSGDNEQSTSKGVKRKGSGTELKNLRLVFDGNNVLMSTSLICPRLIGNKLQSFASEYNESEKKNKLVFGEYELVDNTRRAQPKKLFDFEQTDCDQMGNLRDESFYWSSNQCYACHKTYNSNKIKLFIIDLERKQLFKIDFYSLGRIMELYTNEDGVLTVCVENDLEEQLVVHRVILRQPDTLANLTFNSIRRHTLFQNKDMDILVNKFPSNLRPMTILASKQDTLSDSNHQTTSTFNSDAPKKKRTKTG